MQWLQGKADLLQLRQEIPLNDSELAAVDDGVAAMERYLNNWLMSPRRRDRLLVNLGIKCAMVRAEWELR